MSLSGAKTVYGGFSNDENWEKVVYDFSVDGGTQGDFDVFTAANDLVITDFYAVVDTAMAGATSVYDLGLGDGGTEIWSDKTVAALAVGTVHAMDTETKIKVAAASKIVFGIETADATDGKISFFFKVRKV